MSATPAHVFRTALTVPAAHAPAFAAMLEPLFDAVSWTDDADQRARMLAFVSGPPDEGRLGAAIAEAAEACGIAPPDFSVEQLPLTDWVLDNLKEFAPFSIGRFFIFGAEFTGVVPVGRIGLRVPAGTAFGSGTHGSTQGCLLALEGLARARCVRTVLDMGCGSGILAIAAAKLRASPVLALDVDPAAVRATAYNAKQNGVGTRVTVGRAAGYRTRKLQGRRFDLICANILARPLARMARDCARHLAPGGVAVLSGLLESDGNRIAAAHRAQGLRLRRRYVVDGWLTLVLSRPAPRTFPRPG